jgi:hypothetical protein
MDLRTGTILPSFRKAIYDEMIDNITSNTSHYYAFAAVSDKTSTGAENTANNDYNNIFNPTWKIIFGKKLTANNIIPVIKKTTWAKNTVYEKYDNLNANLHSNSNFYVFSPPAITGGRYNVYKCIDNANGALSTVKPTIIQQDSFQTPDGYKWKYMTSVSYADFQNYSTSNYAPIFANSVISAAATENAGVEIVNVLDGGRYDAYHDGVIQSTPDNTLLQLSADAAASDGAYAESAIYVYNENSATANIYTISSSYSEIVKGSSATESSQLKNWVTLSTTANLSNIIPGTTKYKISPRVVFNTDGTSDPVAYSVVNTFSNSIHKIVVLDTGSDISWANVSLKSSKDGGAVLSAVVSPRGGHGLDPATELDMQGVSINFSFSNTENSTIPTNNIKYDVIGIIKNPYKANTQTGAKLSTRFWSNTMNQMVTGNVSMTFTVGEKVIGDESGAVGEVVFANASQVYLVGDNYFKTETIRPANNYPISFFRHPKPQIVASLENPETSATLKVQTAYLKDIVPLYVQYINTIERPISNGQTESFNLLLQF